MALLYSAADRALVQKLDDLKSQRDGKDVFALFAPYFHPRGIKELAASREIRLLASMLKLIDNLDQQHEAVDSRLAALKSLQQEVIYGSVSSFCMNTARVLVQIMKNLIRDTDHEHALQLAHDLRTALLGNPRFIRAQLEKYHLLEMPEAWNQLSFDYHVHDAHTKGRKSPTHLILDAWLKGIKTLQVIYYYHVPETAARELLYASEIMGIDVRIGVECPVAFHGRSLDLIWAPRGFSGAAGFLNFLKRPETQAFFAGNRRAMEQNKQRILGCLEAFNRHHLEAFRTRLGVELAPPSVEMFLKTVKYGLPSIEHLAEFLAERLAAPKTVELELDHLLRELYGEMYPYNAAADTGDLEPETFIKMLKQLQEGFRLTLNLSGLELTDVIEAVYDFRGVISHLEVFNLKDFAAGIDTRRDEINDFRRAVNRGDIIGLKRIVRTCIEQFAAPSETSPEDVNGKTRSALLTARLEKFTSILRHLPELIDAYARRPLGARIGSDSTGRFVRHPGMGFVILDTLPPRARRSARKTNRVLPVKAGITQMNVRRFAPLPVGTGKKFLSWKMDDGIAEFSQNGNLVTLGAFAGSENAPLPQAPETGRAFWPYLDNNWKIVLKILGGFVPAFISFRLTKDWWLLAWFGAVIWLGITGLRNILQSVLGGGGFKRADLLKWNDFISWQRVADSLFYTGLSVPLLDWLVKSVLLKDTFGITAANDPVALYTLIALANGVYISSHNLLRGLPREAIIGNFFRTFLSIPLAIVLNFMIRGMLEAAQVAAVALILQQWAAIISKTASDIVAGIIEGYADRHKNLQLRFLDYRRKIGQLFAAYTKLELEFPEKNVLAMFKHPKQLIEKISRENSDMDKEIIIDTLDLLYFRMYQPQARTVFVRVLKELTAEEREIFIRTQNVLQGEREISQMFLDGVAGGKFSKILAFYLSYAPAYLREINSEFQ
ncbi:MAG: hypothetical protein PHH77_11625 [Victivallaceae bacterium]|nr:hypothetical protein [Victivallaceae bacterium]